MKKYINQLVIIYEGTTSFENGGVGRILDYDSMSSGETSLYVLPIEYDYKEGIDRLNNCRWVKKSNIKQIIDVSKPKLFKCILKKLMFWKL